MSREQFKDEFQKKYQKHDLKVTSANEIPTIAAISSGIISLDISSGIGGFPCGRIVEIFGPESGGKSLLTLVACAYLQKMDPTANVLYFDVEGGTPREWMETLGMATDRFDVVPNGLTAEENFDAIVSAVENNAYRYIIVDSVAGLVPKAELEGSIDQNYMATLARVMSKGMKKVVSALSLISKANEGIAPCVIFINQIREKPGVMYGNPESTPGGKALLFYAAQRYRVSRKSSSEIKKGGDIVGHTIKISNKKNKLGPPRREAEFSINYTEGIDTVSNIMSLLKAGKFYEKKSQKYILTLGEESLEFDKVGDIEETLRSDLDFQQKIYKLLIQATLNLTAEGIINSDTEEDDFDSLDDKEWGLMG